jgi:hypothetical protein
MKEKLENGIQEANKNIDILVNNRLQLLQNIRDVEADIDRLKGVVMAYQEILQDLNQPNEND